MLFRNEKQCLRLWINSNDRSCPSVYFFKAWIGAAFSLGFIFGPLLGALSSHLGTIYAPKSPVAFFIVPAIVSLLLSLINIAIVTQFCPETLPVAKRVRLEASQGCFLTHASVLRYPGGQEDHGRRCVQRHLALAPIQIQCNP